VSKSVSQSVSITIPLQLRLPQGLFPEDFIIKIMYFLFLTSKPHSQFMTQST